MAYFDRTTLTNKIWAQQNFGLLSTIIFVDKNKRIIATYTLLSIWFALMLHPHFLIIAHITNTYRSVQQLFGADDDNNTDAADASNIGMIEKKKHIKKEPMKNCTLTVQLPCYYIGVYCELI